MKREKEVPDDLLIYLEAHRQQEQNIGNKAFSKLDIFCSMPVHAVRMRILNDAEEDGFRTVIIPSIDIYTSNDAALKKGFLKRDSISYFISGTRRVFPYGHIYANSGYVCLGSIFVPSAVPENSPSMPLETLFLHNDRNLNHGNSHLVIEMVQAEMIRDIMVENHIQLTKLASAVTEFPGTDAIKKDEIWNLSACVAGQKPLLEALDIMSDIYDVIFPAVTDM